MLAEQLLDRFEELHNELDSLKQTADETWYQGGMIWNRKLLKRGAKTVCLDAYHDVFSEYYDKSVRI